MVTRPFPAMSFCGRSLEKNPINESISSPSTVPASGHVSLDETLNKIVGGLCSLSHLISSPQLSLSSHDISFLSYSSHRISSLCSLLYLRSLLKYLGWCEVAVLTIKFEFEDVVFAVKMEFEDAVNGGF